MILEEVFPGIYRA